MKNSKIIVIGLIFAVLSGIIISGFFIFADENAKAIIDPLLPGKTIIDSNLPGKTIIK